MKKLLGLLGTIMITGNAIPSVIATAPNWKHNIKKRQNNENTPTTPKTQDEQQSQFSITSDSKVDIIEKEITLNENYSHNIQKILQELIKNNQLDPLRMINNEGIVRTDYFETQDKRNERENNIKIIEKLDEILELKKFDANKIRILVLTLKNKENNKIKLIINLDNLYLQGFINENNEYFYFDDELLEKIKQNNKEEIIKLNDLRDKLNNLKDNKLLFNEEKVKEYLQKKNKIIPLKEKEKNNKKLNYNNELNYLNKKIIILCGESLKTEEIKTKTLNTKVTEKYNCQKINLNYTGAYSENGLDVVIKEKGKPNRAKDIIISRDTLNNAIANLAKFNNDKNQNQTTKDDLVRMIFITSEAMRFGSYLKYFNYEKDSKQVEFKNIQENIQNIINSKNDDKIQWKDYSEQLIGGWITSSKYLEEKRKKIFEQLNNHIIVLFFISENNKDLNEIFKKSSIQSQNWENVKPKIETIIKNSKNEEYIKLSDVILKYIENLFLQNENEIKFLKTWDKKIIPSVINFINTNNNYNLIRSVIVEGNLDLLKLIITKKPELININNNELTFLQVSIANNKIDIIKLLLANGINVNEKGKYNSSALYTATFYGDIDIVKLLLSHGADVNARNNNGLTLLHVAIDREYLIIVKLSLDNGADVNAKNYNFDLTPLISALSSNNVDIFNELVTNQNSKDKININESNKKMSNFTPLHFAVQKNQINFIKLLLSYGANVKATDKDGNIPLHIAAQNGNLDAVKLLLDNGANPNYQNNNGDDPLDFAKKMKKTEIINLLKNFN
ncbi:ankyrin repeat domain-containing protein [Spiroplasma endosymbiont of Polydrusus pterygomalis]|uniref:ankyrin repeat domain-containing protein n=1 Tax=Spiroplasma endosymbiont of Polydrusus pterygomalis TaxID=3139327 RepID=UPI003CCB21DE